jgi:MFS family permease
MNNSTEHLAPAAEPRWSSSTTPTMATADVEKSTWTPPPVPPIPSNHEEEAWRRRSSKRQSYTSQMTCGTQHRGASWSPAEAEKDVRPISVVSTTSTMEVRDGRLAPRRRPEHDIYGDLHWNINPLNPRNWRRRKKWLHTIAATAITFTATMSSSIVAPTYESIGDSYAVSRDIAILPYALFILGLTLGPFLGRACAWFIGRKLTYLLFVPLFCFFTLGTGLVHGIAGICVCRALAGLFAGPAVSQGCGLVADVWDQDDQTGPLHFYYASLLLGPMAGFVISGYIIVAKGVSWTQWVVLFAAACCMVLVALTSETSRKMLRQQKKSILKYKSLGESRDTAVYGPLRALLVQPVVLLSSLQSGFGFASLYLSFVALPQTMNETYSFGPETQGLSFVSMISGLAIGILLLVLHSRCMYAPKREQWQAERAAEAEKARRRTQRASHASQASTKSAVSNFSRPQLRRPQSSRTLAEHPNNSALSLKRIGAGNTKRPTTAASTASASVDMERSTSLAAAAAIYLNSVEANQGKRILPERIIIILAKNPAFGDLCSALEGFGLHFDKVRLAKVLVDTLPDPNSSPAGMSAPSSALLRSRSLHRSAAAAALDDPAPPMMAPFVPRVPTQVPSTRHVPPAPARWRLWPALLGTILMPASLFVIAWTTSKSIHWIAPCVGMGGFACAVLLIFVPTQLYLWDRYGAIDGGSALAAVMVMRYLLSFAFVMLVLPLYDRLRPEWATSLLAFIAVVLGCISWCLVFLGSKENG